MKENRRLRERDIKILQFINEFGFCELGHLQEWFSIKRSYCYEVMQRLCREGLVLREEVYIRKAGVYRVTKEGATYTDLPALPSISRTQYEHQTKLIEVFIKLNRKYPQAYWFSERRLLRSRNKQDIINKKHIPDALLLFPNENEIAIEVELTLKGKNRLERIFKGYAVQHAITEVWYYTWPNLMGKLKKLAEKRSFIKIYNLKELLYGE